MSAPTVRLPYECPVCGHITKLCDITGCENLATWHGWITGGMLIRRGDVCDEHQSRLKGYEKWLAEQQEEE